MSIAKYIDHTILAANATEAQIIQLCKEAKEYNFFSICINSAYVPLAKEHTDGSDVAVCSVVGFPLGQMDTASKVFEAKSAVANGADEIDMVINVGKMIDGKTDYVQEEIRQIKEAIGSRVLKVILETCYLTKEQIVEASKLSVAANADFVKTSTGFGTGGASFEDIQLMKDAVEGKAALKASGGVRDYETAQKYIDMGVTRLGTSSGIKIIQGGTADEGSY
ncbi:deoxyribose-phosphate aldolase [Flammeovirga kamogawensis]|uniref:Deoxyribose-phosphate aldolase n=1 Tax=Flammeovirga kamogawensis TaxID=373891 RepID=A0ABX8GWV3_9BACT|nr:deoxyribose-phosphate aldolase [Flammeovirga kamogawensis]MBB6460701.1 deoxyribose-phosphate aldolase [Flammeovirga kamogawensis]QWG08056.1 deoxyribose-phosphate aldolase [Flammeovirga kamogawensis]TRX69861.1 deoxyribose-phosphate aldolase [Flammeovirga kamogawensis]